MEPTWWDTVIVNTEQSSVFGPTTRKDALRRLEETPSLYRWKKVDGIAMSIQELKEKFPAGLVLVFPAHIMGFYNKYGPSRISDDQILVKCKDIQLTENGSLDYEATKRAKEVMV